MAAYFAATAEKRMMPLQETIGSASRSFGLGLNLGFGFGISRGFFAGILGFGFVVGVIVIVAEAARVVPLPACFSLC